MVDAESARHVQKQTKGLGGLGIQNRYGYLLQRVGSGRKASLFWIESR